MTIPLVRPSNIMYVRCGAAFGEKRKLRVEDARESCWGVSSLAVGRARSASINSAPMIHIITSRMDDDMEPGKAGSCLFCAACREGLAAEQNIEKKQEG